MQDIAGLRAILASQVKVDQLYDSYINSRLRHELVNEKDYIVTPKDDGYRGIHLVYRYASDRASDLAGLHVELQLRTALQHAWATAVETVDAFMGESIKAGRATEDWASFFCLASAAFALQERAAPPNAHLSRGYDDVVTDLRASEAGLQVAAKLRGFTVAANRISTSGRSRNTYHLVILDMGVRRLSIRSYSATEQQQANLEYQAVEERVRSGEPLNPVLITGGSVDGLRKSYPNYFLDARNFIESVERVIGRIPLSPTRA
ncbi:RelA/SpoT family protein [Luteibacter rhizovicinus]|uniref:RelA/SpoT family protein n=1 Tax=Luteibacter rhizovicinus TaxID=242606 RepID=A0A4R3Z1R2_9GAMM|nr:RelA/SpoT family protein [Luteibacter rhizovicinus]